MRHILYALTVGLLGLTVLPQQTGNYHSKVLDLKVQFNRVQEFSAWESPPTFVAENVVVL